MTTPRCHDLPGPDWPAIATSDGWIPFNEHSAQLLAINGMLLAYGSDHVERLRREGALDALDEECARLRKAAIEAGPSDRW